MGVEVDGFAVVLLAEGGVASVAHFLDHGGAVRVDGHRRRRDAVGDWRLLKGAVEVIESFEFSGEEGVMGEVCDVFGGGVDSDGEEEEGVAGLDGLGGHGVILGGGGVWCLVFMSVGVGGRMGEGGKRGYMGGVGRWRWRLWR